MGICTTIFCCALGGAVTRVLDFFFPGVKGGGVPQWLWPILIVIWTPGIVGYLLSFYSIARYPYLSMATGGGPKVITSRSWIWTLIGSIFYGLAPLAIWAGVGTKTTTMFVLCEYSAVLMCFAGFLFTAYRRERHVTIATFIELTFGVGVIFFPIYAPVILIGSVRCRRFLESLELD